MSRVEERNNIQLRISVACAHHAFVCALRWGKKPDGICIVVSHLNRCQVNKIVAFDNLHILVAC